MGHIQYIIIILFLLLPVVFGASATCFDDGSILISDSEDKGVVYTGIPGVDKWFLIDGEWKENSDGKTYSFHSEEMVFIDPDSKRYTLKYAKNVMTMWCPGFKFSCKMINISVLSCFKTKDAFYANFISQNYEIDKNRNYRLNDPMKLLYEIKTDKGSIYKYNSEIKSNKLKYVDITEKKFKTSSLFTFRWPTKENISQFSISYQDCAQPFYSYKQCTEQEVCIKDTDCKIDEYCNDYNCYPLTCHGCSYQARHKCVSYECCSNDDCGTGQFCSEHQCINLVCSNNYIPKEHECQKIKKPIKSTNQVFNKSANQTINQTIKTNLTNSRPTFFQKIIQSIRKLLNLK